MKIRLEVLAQEDEGGEISLLNLGYVPMAMQCWRQDGQNHHFHGVGDVRESHHEGQVKLESPEAQTVDGFPDTVRLHFGRHFHVWINSSNSKTTDNPNPDM